MLAAPAWAGSAERRRHPEKAAYLTADNQMSRKPNFALNAEMKAVAERLTLPAVLVHFFRFAPTAIEWDCGSRDVSRMMGRTLAAVSSTTRPISSLAQSSRQT